MGPKNGKLVPAGSRLERENYRTVYKTSGSESQQRYFRRGFKATLSRDKLVIAETCVVDPDPHGSGTFAWIRIRNYCSGSGIIVPDPYPAKTERVV